jgi:hypothetical protein
MHWLIHLLISPKKVSFVPKSQLIGATVLGSYYELEEKEKQATNYTNLNREIRANWWPVIFLENPSVIKSQKTGRELVR